MHKSIFQRLISWGRRFGELKWPKLAIYYTKGMKNFNLSHFQLFLLKVEGGTPPKMRKKQRIAFQPPQSMP